MTSGNVSDLDFTLVDFETSGLDPQVDQIIEASVIRVRKGNPVMTFNTLVSLREGITISPYVTDLTGHHETDLEDSIDEEKLAGILSWMLPDDELIIAHNALFDLSFINALWERQGYTGIANEFIDSLTIARDREPFPHKLGDCCKRNGILLSDAHSAEADTFALLDLIIKYHKDKDISDYINVAGYRPKYGEPSWYPEGTKLKKQGAEVVKHGAPAAPKPITTAGIVVSKRTKKIPLPGNREDLP
jgi:DNA polymerase-3 subunit epsilon